jgi:DNA-binding beta-propeller fold protein YncE
MRTRPVRPFGLLTFLLGVALGGLGAGCLGSESENASEVTARIDVPGHPFRIAAGRDFVWVLTRGLAGACAPPRQPCTVLRIDPRANRVVGRPIPLPRDAWDLAAGAGSVWVTQFDGRILRVDARTGRIRPVSARPLYFGSVVAFGGGFVWTGNDDERNDGGTIAKLDPASNRIVGAPLVPARPSSPQSISFSGGALWVADHAGWLVKIDPATFTVVARQRLHFGPHGVVATQHAAYIADAHGNRLLEADPKTAKIRRVAKLSPGPIFPVFGARWLWSSSAAQWSGATGERDDRVLRIDPESLEVAEVVHVGGSVPSVAFAFGSVWAADNDGRVVRITPPTTTT